METVTEIEIVFNESSLHWRRDYDYNKYFLLAQQNYFNNCLATRGHVFLNEVFDALGMKRTTQGAISGWIGKSFIHFGIQNKSESEMVITLTFNIDGVIYDKIED